MLANELKAGMYFKHKGKIYLRITPGKKMFHSTMVHEVINRGDIFAVNMDTAIYTVIPGKDKVELASLTIQVETIKFKPMIVTEERFAQGDLFR